LDKPQYALRPLQLRTKAATLKGDTLDFMLSERRDEDAATAFFKQAINNNGLPDKVVMELVKAKYALSSGITILLKP
jgi:putative transposase